MTTDTEHGLDPVIERVEHELTGSQKRTLELMAELKDLEAQKAVLEDKLEHAIRLKFFYPAAFDTGSCKVYPRGNASKPAEMQFIIRTGDGIEHIWNLLEVPVELWAKWKPKFRADCSMMRSPKQWRD